MNDLTVTGDRRMTIREVAEIFGVQEQLIRKHARELYPDLMQNGVTTYLNEEQITTIKQKMRPVTLVTAAITEDERMTLKEVAEAIGVAYRTVAEYAQKAGWTENGKQTLLDERQVTVILEAMKVKAINGVGEAAKLASVLQATETSQSRILRLQILQKQMQDIYEAEIAELKAKTEADKPKVEFFDQVAGSGSAISMREVAAVLNIPGWGQNKIYALLRKVKVLDSSNIPYRDYQDRGYFRVIEQKYSDPDGETHISLKTLVYQRGVDFIRKIIQKQEVAA